MILSHLTGARSPGGAGTSQQLGLLIELGFHVALGFLEELDLQLSAGAGCPGRSGLSGGAGLLAGDESPGGSFFFFKQDFPVGPLGGVRV